MGVNSYCTNENLIVEAGFNESGIYEIYLEGPAPTSLSNEAIKFAKRFSLPTKNTDVDINVNFTAEGYVDHGRYTGRPEDCYPASSEDERVIQHIELYNKENKVKICENDVGGVAWKEICDFLEEKVNEVDVDTDSNDYEPDIDPDDFDDIRYF